MPRPTKKALERQKTWESKINRALKVRKHYKEQFKVNLGRDYFEGKQQPPGWPTEEWLTINEIYSNLKALLPSLYQIDPYFHVNLRRAYNVNPMEIALWEVRGKIRAATLNYLKTELKLKSKVRVCIQDAHFAFGAMKTHFHSDSVDNPDAGAPIMGENEKPLLDEETGDPLLEPDTLNINDEYRVTRIHPDDFLWDEDAGPLEDSWTWVGQQIRMTLETAKKDKRYKKAALNRLKDRGPEKDAETKARDERKKGDIAGRSDIQEKKGKKEKQPELITFWEIYEIKKKKWTTIAMGGDIPIVDAEPYPPGVEEHPFSILRFTLRDDSPYPIPPVSQALDPQRELNQTHSRVQTHLKRFNRHYHAWGNWPEEELSKLESGGDGTIVTSQTRDAGIEPIQDAPLDQQNIMLMSILKPLVAEPMGSVHDEAKGIASADSATQSGILEKRLEIKEGDALSEVIDFVTDIARKQDMLVQEHLTGEQAVKVSGPKGEHWEHVREQDYEKIEGEYEYTVNVGATTPRMPQIERASWQAFLTMVANFWPFMLSKRLLKQTAEQHHIEDEIMLEEIADIGLKILSGQIQAPGPAGSQAGVGEDRPASASGGMAGGFQSLNQPGAGNIQ